MLLLLFLLLLLLLFLLFCAFGCDYCVVLCFVCSSRVLLFPRPLHSLVLTPLLHPHLCRSRRLYLTTTSTCWMKSTSMFNTCTRRHASANCLPKVHVLVWLSYETGLDCPVHAHVLCCTVRFTPHTHTHTYTHTHPPSPLLHPAIAGAAVRRQRPRRHSSALRTRGLWW